MADTNEMAGALEEFLNSNLPDKYSEPAIIRLVQKKLSEVCGVPMTAVEVDVGPSLGRDLFISATIYTGITIPDSWIRKKREHKEAT